MDDLGHAAAVLHDLHTVAELNVAIVALGHLHGSTILALDGHLDAAAAAAAAMPVIDVARNAATDRAQQAADQDAAQATPADDSAERRTAGAANQATRHGSAAHPLAATAAGTRKLNLVDRDHAAGAHGHRRRS